MRENRRLLLLAHLKNFVWKKKGRFPKTKQEEEKGFFCRQDAHLTCEIGREEEEPPAKSGIFFTA